MTLSNWLTIAGIVVPLAWQNWHQARKTRQHQDATVNRRLTRLENAVRGLTGRMNRHITDPRGHTTMPPRPRAGTPTDGSTP